MLYVINARKILTGNRIKLVWQELFHPQTGIICYIQDKFNLPELLHLFKNFLSYISDVIKIFQILDLTPNYNMRNTH